jgi:hypothetical protein
LDLSIEVVNGGIKVLEEELPTETGHQHLMKGQVRGSSGSTWLENEQPSVLECHLVAFLICHGPSPSSSMHKSITSFRE